MFRSTLTLKGPTTTCENQSNEQAIVTYILRDGDDNLRDFPHYYSGGRAPLTSENLSTLVCYYCGREGRHVCPYHNEGRVPVESTNDSGYVCGGCEYGNVTSARGLGPRDPIYDSVNTRTRRCINCELVRCIHCGTKAWDNRERELNNGSMQVCEFCYKDTLEEVPKGTWDHDEKGKQPNEPGSDDSDSDDFFDPRQIDDAPLREPTPPPKRWFQRLSATKLQLSDEKKSLFRRAKSAVSKGASRAAAKVTSAYVTFCTQHNVVVPGHNAACSPTTVGKHVVEVAGVLAAYYLSRQLVVKRWLVKSSVDTIADPADLTVTFEDDGVSKPRERPKKSGAQDGGTKDSPAAYKSLTWQCDGIYFPWLQEFSDAYKTTCRPTSLCDAAAWATALGLYRHQATVQIARDPSKMHAFRSWKHFLGLVWVRLHKTSVNRALVPSTLVALADLEGANNVSRDRLTDLAYHGKCACKFYDDDALCIVEDSLFYQVRASVYTNVCTPWYDLTPPVVELGRSRASLLLDRYTLPPTMKENVRSRFDSGEWTRPTASEMASYSAAWSPKLDAFHIANASRP